MGWAGEAPAERRTIGYRGSAGASPSGPPIREGLTRNGLPKPLIGIAIVPMVNIINIDITNLVIGIVMVNCCEDKEEKE